MQINQMDAPSDVPNNTNNESPSKDENDEERQNSHTTRRSERIRNKPVFYRAEITFEPDPHALKEKPSKDRAKKQQGSRKPKKSSKNEELLSPDSTQSSTSQRRVSPRNSDQLKQENDEPLPVTPNKSNHVKTEARKNEEILQTPQAQLRKKKKKEVQKKSKIQADDAKVVDLRMRMRMMMTMIYLIAHSERENPLKSKVYNLELRMQSQRNPKFQSQEIQSS